MRASGVRMAIVLMLAALASSTAAWASDPVVSFNLSTSKSFAPGEQPAFHLYTHNVDALEFRVYRVDDPVKFMENLRELHSFGTEASLLGKEQIDERSWLERFHDWKSEVWDEIRDFFRGQFSQRTRHLIRDRRGSVVRHSRILSEAEFAQVPILNQSQLVSRWRLQVPSTFISDQSKLVAPKLPAGLYLLEATDGRFKAYTLLMVTQMALVTRTTPGHVMAFVVDRSTGQPIAGAKVDAGIGQRLIASASTDAEGVAQLAVPVDKSSPDNFWVVAAKGSEFAASTPGGWALNLSGNDTYAGYVFTERPVYRPTHTVHWKAMLRAREGDLLVEPKGGTVEVTISDGSDKPVFDRRMTLPSNGELSGDFELPKDAALGYYTLSVFDPDAGAGNQNTGIACGFHVEDYRKPEYRVQVNPAQKRVLQGATMTVTIDSRYFFGEPVANAKVKYRVYHERHYWWGEDEDEDTPAADAGAGDADPAEYAGDEETEQTGKLNANGTLVIQVPTRPEAAGNLHPDLDYTVEAGVTDAANREITGRGRFLATYGSFRVHVEPVTYAVRAGEQARFRLAATDYDEKPVSTRVHVQLVFHHWQDGKSETIQGPAVDVATDATGHAEGQIAVGTPQYSSAEITATAAPVKPGTRSPVDESYLWIMGASEVSWDSSSEATQIVADKKSYAPGDTAHLSIVSEASGFYALVLVEGETLIKRETVQSVGRTLSFDLPITAQAMPNLTVTVLFLKDSTLYQATKTLQVPPTQQRLQVQITPAKDLFEPQQAVGYDVFTRDAAGKPVSADVSVGVVDEAIYSLYPDTSGDMVKVLYPRRSVEAAVDSSLDYYFSGEAGDKSPMLAMREARYRPQLAQVKPGNEAKPRVRKAFPDTAFWAPEVHTDLTGHAHISFTFPDSLTTWRTTVHAITPDTRAGSAINRVLVRKNVIVRMGTPRFMVKGDEIKLPVIVHNYLETPMRAKISLKVEGLDAIEGSEQTLAIASKGEATAFWRLRASQVGTAKLTASATADEDPALNSDALELSFPVNPAGAAETLARNGVIAQNSADAATTISFPANTDPAAHSIRVEVSPSIAGSLIPALRYLSTYPYGCTEQTMSSYLPNVVVMETLSKLNGAGGVDPADVNAKMQAGLDRLKDYQHEDGGWGWWKEDESRVAMTAYVVSGLGQGARFAKLSWPHQTMLNQGRSYLEKALADHPKMRPELRAAVVYALAESQSTAQRGAQPLGPEFDRLWSRRNDLEPEALAMTGLAMLDAQDTRAAEVTTLLASEAVHQGELVSWKGSYLPLLDYDETNDTEATAYAVRLLAKVNPEQPLLPGAAQWLMLARDGGVWWNSTEQTAMVLFGLIDYLAVSHELESDFTVQALVNDRVVGERHFTAADAQSGASLALDIDAGQLQAGANRVRIVRRGGRGRAYWSVRGQFFSTDKSAYQAGSMSLNLTRDYFKLQPVQKDAKIVYTLVPLNGIAQVGDVLAVHEAINGTPMRYLLLEDPIPAGVEFIQNEASYPIEQRPGGWYDWFTRREFHDDHAAFFASEFSGRQEVFYLVRVVNPGSFAISPARVQPMYQHGVQATSDSLRLQVPQPTGGPQ